MLQKNSVIIMVVKTYRGLYFRLRDREICCLLTAKEDLSIICERKWDARLSGCAFVFVHSYAQMILSRVQLY